MDHSISFALLQTITNDFSDELKIASDTYGDVYKVKLRQAVYDGKDIAVRRFRSSQGFNVDDREFENEVKNLCKVRHRNVVRLIGWCSEKRQEFVPHGGKLVLAQLKERALCFEYMHGGSLDKHISDECCNLDWPACYKIIIGTCVGLNHLHNAQERPIFHLDLKIPNIWLDKNMTAKIANIGLSRLFGSPRTPKTWMPKGTFGYMPLEYIQNGMISPTFDVFGLGIIIIRIMVWNGSAHRFHDVHPEHFVEHVTEKWTERLQGTLGYSSQQDILQVETCIRIALRCVEAERKRRPRVKDIINELEILEPEMIKKMLLPSDQSDDDLTGQRSPHREPVSMLTATPSSSSTNFSLPDVQSYKEPFPQTFGENSSMEDIHKELKVLECILVGSKNPSNLKLPTLQFITKKFSHDLKIGNGGCAEVYKGILGNRIIAVKKLFSSRTIDDKMFHQEVQSLMLVNHKNVVSFLGYCSHTEGQALRIEGKYFMAEARERLLCFEYMSNGSLENYLTDELRGLEWLRRYQIIKGICDGLHHLHRIHYIIHMDLKPANILLDNNMVPKITDFGLSRFDDRSRTMSSDRLLSL